MSVLINGQYFKKFPEDIRGEYKERIVVLICSVLPEGHEVGELCVCSSKYNIDHKTKATFVVCIPLETSARDAVTLSSSSLNVVYALYDNTQIQELVGLKQSFESTSAVFVLEAASHEIVFEMTTMSNFFLTGDFLLKALNSLPNVTQESTKDNYKKIWYAPHKFEAYGEEEIAAVERCLRNGWLAPGPEMARFEQSVAEYFGKKFGLMVNSGSSANLVALAVLGLEKGSKVLTPALTFSTVVAPIVQLGLEPVFIDTTFATYVPSVEQVMEKWTPDIKVIMLPNLIGSKPDWAELRRRLPKDVILIEDSCDCMTRTMESDIAVCSFYASHIITAGGCGGVVMFNDDAYIKKGLMYRDWGRIGTNSEDMSERFAHSVDGIEYDFKFLYGVLGYNLKCSEMNAAFGNAQMAKLPHFIQKRRDNIATYCKTLEAAGTQFVLPKNANKFDWLAMPLQHPCRKFILQYLEDRNVQVRVCFAGNITRHPAYRQYLSDYPDADRCMRDGFLLGAHHGLDKADIEHVCKLLIEADKKCTKKVAS